MTEIKTIQWYSDYWTIFNISSHGEESQCPSVEGRIRERRTQLRQFTGLDWESPRWSSINAVIHRISQTSRCSFLNQGWRGRGHLTLCGNMIQLQMNLIKFSFSDAFSNTDPNIDIWVCLCKKWGIMHINKLLICWQLLQKRKSEHPNCPFSGVSFKNDSIYWFYHNS